MIARTRILPSIILGLLLVLGSPLIPAQISGLLGVNAAHAATIRTIVVNGNQRVDDSTIVSFLAVRKGQNATASKIDESIDALYQSGLFSTVNVASSGSTLRVTVKENPIISSVLFEGNQKFSDAKLSDLVDVGSRGVYTEAAVAQDARNIELAYDQAGFNAVSVTTRVESAANSRLKVVFVVDEGDRSGIAKITFTGNKSIGDAQLKAAIRTRESHLLSFLFRDDVYDEDKLNVDSELVRLYYADRGFPDAQVLSAVAERDLERNAYFINFTIDEGERYEFGTIGIETSIAGIDANTLRSSIRTHEGRRYSVSSLQRTAADMARDAAYQGHSFAEVRPRIDRDLENKRFNITYLVDEGARLYVERINIYGNTRTRDFVIRREFEFAEGDPFNRTFLAAGRESLQALGFFSQVQVNAEQGSSADQVVINVVVEEKSTGSWGGGANYSPQSGFGVELSLEERNFLGKGQSLKLALGGTFGSRTYDFSFTEPKFMGLNISAGIDVYRRTIDEDKYYNYGTDSTGFQVRIGAPIVDKLQLGVFGGYDITTFSDGTGTPPKPIDKPAYIPTSLQKAFLGYSLTYTDVDSQLSPSEGYAISLVQQYVGIDHNLLKTELKGRYYIPVLPDHGVIASVKGQVGMINALGGSNAHPTETFVPGQNLIRGFKARGFGPKNGSNSLGISEYATLSAEVEFPIPVVPESYGLKGAIWADAAYLGASAINPALITSGNTVQTRTSIGASILWDSPLGPLRGDFAHVLDKDVADQTQVFALTISTLF
ncbi:outer membrane protein assembly factor BamA [Maritalea sp.]|uniref:outer membrane protein assembly factor BamA n=1 Tax=Maritalea sp. TaxID=2003361 RepID=UPI003EF9E44D